MLRPPARDKLPDMCGTSETVDTLRTVERQTLQGLASVAGLLDPEDIGFDRPQSSLRMVVAERRVRDIVDGAHRELLVLLTRHVVDAAQLRLAAALLYTGRAVYRMCDECADIYGSARAGANADGDHAAPPSIVSMSELVRRQIRLATDALASRHAELTRGLRAGHDEIDDLNRELIRCSLDGDDGTDRRPEIQFALVGECLLRISEEAVEIGEQVVFLGDHPRSELPDPLSQSLTPPITQVAPSQ
jgi:phosphate uptake regulator